VPGAPTIGTATAGNGQATVSWTAPAPVGAFPVTGYVVTPYVGSVPLPSTTFNSTATTRIVTGLTNGTTYTFTVAAINAVGTGPMSGQSNPVTPFAPAVPTAPTIGTATAGNGNAMLSWTAPASNGGSTITGYVVTPYIGGTAQPPRNFFSPATTQTIILLTNGTTYTFTVAAVNAVGTGPVSAASKPVTVGTPTAPTIGTATAGNGSATVSWTPPATDNGSPIIVYVVTAYVGYFPAVSVLAGASATSRTVPGLTNGTTYRFRVRAFNAVGLGDFSKVTNPVTPTA
jgi:predicted phage tail protein